MLKIRDYLEATKAPSFHDIAYFEGLSTPNLKKVIYDLVSRLPEMEENDRLTDEMHAKRSAENYRAMLAEKAQAEARRAEEEHIRRFTSPEELHNRLLALEAKRGKSHA